MSKSIEITNFQAPELDVYARTSENQLVNRANPAEGMFIAESPRVIERALDAGFRPVSCLVEKRQIEGEARDILERLGEIPVYTAEMEVLSGSVWELYFRFPGPFLKKRNGRAVEWTYCEKWDFVRRRWP